MNKKKASNITSKFEVVGSLTFIPPSLNYAL